MELLLGNSSKTPSHTTIYNWVMKLGVGAYGDRKNNHSYQAFIVDATIQHGCEKLLLILGVRKNILSTGNMSLTHEDVDVLHMKVSSKINFELVRDCLKKTISMFRVPRQIVSDHGGDIIKGIKKIKILYPEIANTYDITHMCALELKHALKHDDNWNSFYRECGNCRRNILQTDLMKYAPPKSREKSRHLNLKEYRKWFEKIIYVSNLKENKEFEKFQHAFNWVLKYKKDFKQWSQLIDMLEQVKNEVKRNGLHLESNENIEKIVRQNFSKIFETTSNSYSNIKLSLSEEVTTIKEGEIFLGCSDIIESIFGRIKNYAKNAPFKEIPRMAMAVMIFTNSAIMDKLQIKKIFENKTVGYVTKWLKNNIGPTYIQKRAKAFRKRRVCIS